MTLPASLLTNLVDFWTVDADIANGTNWTELLETPPYGGGPGEFDGLVNAHPMALDVNLDFAWPYSNRSQVGYCKEGVRGGTWAEDNPPYNLFVPGGTWCYSGGGGEVVIGSDVLTEVGSGVTFAMRYAPEGFVFNPYNTLRWIKNIWRQVVCEIGFLDEDDFFLQHFAVDFNNELCGLGNTVPFRFWTYNVVDGYNHVNVAGSSVPGAASAISSEMSNEFGTFPPFNIVVRITRVASNEYAAEVFIDGVKSGTDARRISTNFASLSLNCLAINRRSKSDPVSAFQWGGFTEAAIWARPLTDEEITAIGEDGIGSLPDIQDDEDAGPGTDNPIITEDGESALNPEWPIEGIDAAVVLATEGPQRHTRRPHRIAPRRYSIRATLGRQSELELIQELIRTTRDGARATRWRHPVDDPPASRIDELPLYRLISHQFSRTQGGCFGTYTLVLEEVI